MPTEAELLQAEIDQYDALISNRQHQQQSSMVKASTHYHPYNQSNYHGHQQQANNRWATRGGHYSRGRGRGAGVPQVYRNRSLVLNSAASSTSSNQAPAAQGEVAPSPAWISRSDRHLQLINPAIFEKETQTRAKAIEETRQLKLRQKDERERKKLAKYLRRSSSTTSSATSSAKTAHEITVQDVKFCVTKNGSKLLKLPGDANAAKATPKTAVIGGVLFRRSKNGNLYRASVVKAHGYECPLDRNCKLSGTSYGANTFLSSRRSIKKINEPCKVFSTTGSCYKGPSCRYLHDADKVAVCKDFLMKGECLAKDSCDLSHDLTPERTPACLHFAKGNCSKDDCPYIHVYVAASAPVCRAFAIYGYCEKGATCTERHVYECPDFSNTGSCNIKGCKLPHKLKASVIRRNTATVDDDASSDLSSDDDDDAIDSDDIDSDDMDDEFVTGATWQDDSIERQDDFVHL